MKKIILVLCLMTLQPSIGAARATNPFTVEWDKDAVTLDTGGVGNLSLLIRIPSGYFLYRDKTGIELAPDIPFQIRSQQWPRGTFKHDPFHNREMELLEGDLVVPVTIQRKETAQGTLALKGELFYQGCSQTFCYREERHPFSLKVASPSPAGAEGTLRDGGQGWSLGGLLRSSDYRVLLNLGPWLAILIAFLGGVLTDFTPCVLPLIPLTLGFIGLRKEGSRYGNLRLAAALTLGMSIMYTGLGLVAVALGKTLGFLFQSPIFLATVAIFFLTMALAVWGIIHLQAPNFIRQRAATWGGAGMVGAVGVGLGFGIVAAPCVGPILAPLLIFVAKERDFAMGGLLLFAYAVGMGSLFFIVAAAGGTLWHRLKSGAVMTVVKGVLGLMLLVPAIYYGGLALKGGSNPERQPALHGSSWRSDLLPAERDARAEGRPILIDFYATWCLPCIELEKTVFDEPAIREELTPWVTVRIDCTTETPACKAAVERFDVAGWPTVVIINSHGTVRDDLRIVGRVPSPEEFLQILGRVGIIPEAVQKGSEARQPEKAD